MEDRLRLSTWIRSWSGINLGKPGGGGVTWGSIRTVSELHEGMDIAVSLPSPVPINTIQHILSAQIIFLYLDGKKEGRRRPTYQYASGSSHL